eukprot:CAMPEP_0178396178 /NCGR_PEP_ID=MMETSP0689_2-20121128/13597_1 /TAXON_ID=160604 /ORGANISM="Amphidinium massartii, Strain CS-259" /LENGTH=278 /DNA_ID=CAMNT_0020016849 /DNA_START=96 /DNA_END=929 /DNA_ORIENTATION=+
MPSLAKVVIDFTLTMCTMVAGNVVIGAAVAFFESGALDKASVVSFLELLCPVMQIGLMISPLPIVFDAVRRLNVQDLPLQVFQSQAACNVLGVAYAIQVSNSAVLVTNMFGLLCQTFYLSGEHFVRTSNTGWFWFSAKLSLIFNAGVYICIDRLPLGILGKAITVGNVILYASPLAKLGAVLKTKNASSIPTAYTVVACINNAIWSVYALLLPDMVIFLPSFLGFQLACFQMILILWSKQRLPFDLGYLLLICSSGGYPGSPVMQKAKSDAPEELIQL